MCIASENTWYSMDSPDSPDQTFWSVEYLNTTQTVRFGTYGRGIWDFKISEFFSPTKVDDNQNLTETLKIELNAYPNPFNGQININVLSSKSSSYNVRIFDINGNLVKQLYSGTLNAGINQFEWDGKSIDGNELPNGIYLLTAASQGITNYLKLNLVR
ncbi:MAG: FlgD immunoglobulin-like domain containing protein, partial [FCB group bacterium]